MNNMLTSIKIIQTSGDTSGVELEANNLILDLDAGVIQFDAHTDSGIERVQLSVGVKDISSSALLNSLKTVDGSGSNLDADLLDGRQGYGYAKYGYTSGSLLTTGSPTATSSGASQMYRFYDSSNLIGEGSDVYYGVIQIYYTSSYYIRIAVSMSSGKVYRQTSGTTAWSEITPTIPVVSSDPTSPSEGQMWILSS